MASCKHVFCNSIYRLQHLFSGGPDFVAGACLVTSPFGLCKVVVSSQDYKGHPSASLQSVKDAICHKVLPALTGKQAISNAEGSSSITHQTWRPGNLHPARCCKP